MSRTNVFIEAGNENRTTSVGGRRGASSGWARINTDNGGQSDCAVVVRVDVTGDRGGKLRVTCDCGYKFAADETLCPQCHAIRGGLDTRKSKFEVELPDQNDEHCEVRIVEHGHRLSQVARIGAALCVMKGITDQAHGKQGKLTVNKALEILQEIEDEAGKNLPNVILPGGVPLKHALACVEVCRHLAKGQRGKN